MVREESDSAFGSEEIQADSGSAIAEVPESSTDSQDAPIAEGTPASSARRTILQRRVSVTALLVSTAVALMVGAGAVATIGYSPLAAAQRHVSSLAHRLSNVEGDNAVLTAGRASVEEKAQQNESASQQLDQRSADLDKREAAVAAIENGIKATSFAGEGVYVVGRDIQPGTYRSAGPSGVASCYWARLSADGSDIIDNDLGDGPEVVTVQPSDGLLKVNRCQTFTKIG